jgi:hypothetical protein
VGGRIAAGLDQIAALAAAHDHRADGEVAFGGGAGFVQSQIHEAAVFLRLIAHGSVSSRK